MDTSEIPQIMKMRGLKVFQSWNRKVISPKWSRIIPRSFQAYLFHERTIKINKIDNEQNEFQFEFPPRKIHLGFQKRSHEIGNMILGRIWWCWWQISRSHIQIDVFGLETSHLRAPNHVPTIRNGSLRIRSGPQQHPQRASAHPQRVLEHPQWVLSTIRIGTIRISMIQ